MKINHLFILLTPFVLAFSLCHCTQNHPEAQTNTPTSDATALGGQASVSDDVSQKDIVKVAIGSKDHTTLVAALKAAEYVDVLANAGPFTVFAPVNAAFEALPAGTVEGLLKPDKKDALRNVLEYHVAVAVYKPEMLRDGQKINMANGDDIVISIKDGKTIVNGSANILASVPASNGIIHIVDGVLLQPSK